MLPIENPASDIKSAASLRKVDSSSGQCRPPSAANLEEAKTKSMEIAPAVVQGKPDVLNWEDGRRAEIRKAIEAIGSTGITILTQTLVVLLEQVTWALLDRNAVVSPSRKPVPIQPSNRAALETNLVE